MEDVKRATEYPIGDGGLKLVESYAKARALRDLGVPTDALKKDYKLDTATATLTIAFRDGKKRELAIGGSVFASSGGSSDRYALDKESGKAYVLARDMLSALEIGQSSMNLVDPRGFDAAKVGEVTIEAAGHKPKVVARVTTGSEGQQVKTWGDPRTKKANQTLANFVDNAGNLRPTEYKPQLKVETLTPVVKLAYRDERGGRLGSLTVYKTEKPPEIPEGMEIDPANPPRGETEYYVVTERTRVPGVVRKDTAQRVEQDLTVVFSDNPPAEIKKDVPNPFGDAPLPPRPAPGPGSAAGSAAAPAPGSAAPPTGPHGASGAVPPAASAPGAGSASKPPAPAGSASAPAGSASAPRPAPPAADPHAGHGH